MVFDFLFLIFMYAGFCSVSHVWDLLVCEQSSRMFWWLQIVVLEIRKHGLFFKLSVLDFTHSTTLNTLYHGLRTPREEIAFTARPKIHSHSQIIKYGQSIRCLPHWPNFSDIFDLCLHWVSVVRALYCFLNSRYHIWISVVYSFFKKSPLWTFVWYW